MGAHLVELAEGSGGGRIGEALRPESVEEHRVTLAQFDAMFRVRGLLVNTVWAWIRVSREATVPQLLLLLPVGGVRREGKCHTARVRDASIRSAATPAWPRLVLLPRSSGSRVP